jgi:HEAT repeat protein
MRGIPADRVAPILLKRMHATTGDHPEYARAAAIKAMAVHRHPAVVEPIIAALEDPDQTVRFAAMRALRAYRDGRAIEPLRAYVRNSENRSQSPGGVAEALDAIGEIERSR